VKGQGDVEMKKVLRQGQKVDGGDQRTEYRQMRLNGLCGQRTEAFRRHFLMFRFESSCERVYVHVHSEEGSEKKDSRRGCRERKDVTLVTSTSRQKR
jgi:hypothetical protein